MFDFNLSEDEAAIDIALAFYDEGYNVVPLQRSNKKPKNCSIKSTKN